MTGEAGAPAGGAAAETRRSLEAAAEVVEGARTLTTTGHINPDGDALGAALGLALAARAEGRQADSCFGGGFVLPGHFAFLDTSPLRDPGGAAPPDVLAAFDVNDPERLGEEMQEVLAGAGSVVMVDHHISGPGFGDVQVLDPDAPAAALLCFRLIRTLGWKLPPEAAAALLLGLVTDTGRFQYSSTNPEAFRAAAELVEAGARPDIIGVEVFESAPFGYLGVAGSVLSRAVLEPERSLVWSFVTQEDLRSGNIGIEDADGLIDAVRTAREAEVALLAKEQPDGGKWKLSLRSRWWVDVSAVAEELGGGGHRRASGCEVEGTLAEAVEAVRRRLPEPAAE